MMINVCFFLGCMDAAASQQRSDWTVHGCLQNLRNEREYEIHGELVNRERLLNLLTRIKKPERILYKS